MVVSYPYYQKLYTVEDLKSTTMRGLVKLAFKGHIAQLVEQSAHNGSAVGSNPAVSTK